MANIDGSLICTARDARLLCAMLRHHCVSLVRKVRVRDAIGDAELRVHLEGEILEQRMLESRRELRRLRLHRLQRISSQHLHGGVGGGGDGLAEGTGRRGVRPAAEESARARRLACGL